MTPRRGKPLGAQGGNSYFTDCSYSSLLKVLEILFTSNIMTIFIIIWSIVSLGTISEFAGERIEKSFEASKS